MKADSKPWTTWTQDWAWTGRWSERWSDPLGCCVFPTNHELGGRSPQTTDFRKGHWVRSILTKTVSSGALFFPVFVWADECYRKTSGFPRTKIRWYLTCIGHWINHWNEPILNIYTWGICTCTMGGGRSCGEWKKFRNMLAQNDWF